MTHGAPGRTSWQSAMIAERLGRLLHQRARERDRRHRAHEREGRDDHALTVAGQHHDGVEDLRIDPPGRIDVGHGQERGALGQLPRRVQPCSMADISIASSGLLAAHPARRPDEVGIFDVRPEDLEVPRRHRNVDGLDHDPALPVHHAQAMGQPQDVPEVLDGTVAATALPVADVRRSADGPEVHDVAAHVQVPCGVARVQHETLRRMRQLGLDQFAPEAHELRASSTSAPARR